MEKLFSIFSLQRNANKNYIELPSHSSQNSYHQQNKKEQMLARMQEWGWSGWEGTIRHYGKVN
jgi:hypothetical protein